MNKLIKLYVAIIISTVICSCSGGDNNNPTTPTPTPSENTQKVTAVRTSTVATSCANGGITVEVGIDDNENGILDDDEVDSSEEVCNGTDGRDALISLASLGAGATCAAGGILIESGPDLNRDGSLQANEITATSPICNGVNGTVSSNFAYIIDLSTENPSQNCSNGGTRIDTGSDLNLDSVLSENEITSTAYVCNGVVTLENTAPIVPDMTNYDLAVNESLSATLVADDSENDRLEFIITQQPQQGVITEFSAMTGDYRYEPADNFIGTDSFQYKADDGKAMSTISTVNFNIAKSEVPANAFQIDSTNLSIIDYPDGVTEREFLVHGITKNNVLVANLESPSAISALNLKALAGEEENAVSPLVTAKLLQIPNGMQSIAITVTLLDGNDTTRTLGERQLSFTHHYYWNYDGTNLSLHQDTTQNGQATYYTDDGTLAVSLLLDTPQTDIVKILNGDTLAFDVGSLFDQGQLKNVLNSGVKTGIYAYKIAFSETPVVDGYGNSFSHIEGTFQVSTNLIPTVTNQSNTLGVSSGQLTQSTLQLSASGGTGDLTFSITDSTYPGTVVIEDDSQGIATYEPFAPNLLVSDSFAFNVSDGLLDSEKAKYDINISDDLAAAGNGSLKLAYNTDTSSATISWTDSWEEELGFRIEKYNFNCGCWELAETLAPSNLSGLPITWSRQPSSTSYYKVSVVLPEGVEVLKPGILVAHVDDIPQIKLDQTEPVSGVVNFSLENTPANVRGVNYNVDLAHVCTLSTGYYYYSGRHWPSFSCSYNTTYKADGTHQLTARISYQSGSYVDLATSFSSLNPGPLSDVISSSTRLYTGFGSSWTPPSGYYDIQVKAAQASSGIASVNFKLDQIDYPVLIETNSHWGYRLDFCDDYSYYYFCEDPYSAYAWRVNPTIPGAHPYEILITANDGNTREITGTIFVNIPITLYTPTGDAISGSLLTINGTVGVTNNPIVITVSLGNRELLVTEGPNFTTTYNMSDLPTGNYTLRITAKDIISGHSSTLNRTLNYTK